MAKPQQRIFYTVDPLDRWVRITVLAESYGEPASSLHDFVRDAGIKVKWRGCIPYVNERHYQDAIEALPEDKPKKAETEQTKRTEKSDGQKKDRRRRNARKAPVREVEVPGMAGTEPGVLPRLRLQEGGV